VPEQEELEEQGGSYQYCQEELGVHHTCKDSRWQLQVQHTGQSNPGKQGNCPHHPHNLYCCLQCHQCSLGVEEEVGVQGG